jgi:electron transfer flavoprotein alpha subunit
VGIGPKAAVAAGAFDTVIQVSLSQFQKEDPLAVCDVLVELQQKRHFDSILVPATPFGRMLAPRLAMSLNTGLVADVTAIRHEGGQLLAIRPAYSGRIMAAISFAGAGPVMMSIRPGFFHWDRQTGKNTQMETIT